MSNDWLIEVLTPNQLDIQNIGKATSNTEKRVSFDATEYSHIMFTKCKPQNHDRIEYKAFFLSHFKEDPNCSKTISVKFIIATWAEVELTLQNQLTREGCPYSYTGA